jgi:hypothetical protein
MLPALPSGSLPVSAYPPSRLACLACLACLPGLPGVWVMTSRVGVKECLLFDRRPSTSCTWCILDSSAHVGPLLMGKYCWHNLQHRFFEVDPNWIAKVCSFSFFWERGAKLTNMPPTRLPKSILFPFFPHERVGKIMFRKSQGFL